MNIYLDVCCLNRPFDDQSQPRIRLETEAVIFILAECDVGRWTQLASEISRTEILAIHDSRRRRDVLKLLPPPESLIYLSSKVERRARELMRQRFKAADALHLAAAEQDADVFLTCDDRLIGTARRAQGDLRVIVSNPVAWLEAQKLP